MPSPAVRQKQHRTLLGRERIGVEQAPLPQDHRPHGSKMAALSSPTGCGHHAVLQGLGEFVIQSPAVDDTQRVTWVTAD
jgi:hypothetical protein